MIKGDKKVMRLLEGLKKKTESVDLFAAGELVRGDAVRSIQDVSRGRKYGNHVAAKKGDAPNTDTGLLVGTSRTEVAPNTAKVIFPVKYAAALEFGDHPFLVPAMKRQKQAALEETARSIAEDLRKVK